MKDIKYKVGTVEASEQLIVDLYLDLRKKMNMWASITHQTAQARMGYIGQHLVSVVTGYVGGKSGARGKDLILGNDEYAEIKTCYRIDQLGKCNACNAVVASIETECSKCSSTNIKRNDDSKWLISIQNDVEFEDILSPKYYYLVLFDFLDLKLADKIRASIWQVETAAPGFALCMADYYLNIRSKSKSKAPFNLWPFQLKFELMRPLLIYRSYIDSNKVETVLFPGKHEPELQHLKQLKEYSRSKNLTKEKLIHFSCNLGLTQNLAALNKNKIIEILDEHINSRSIDCALLADSLAKAIYTSGLQANAAILPIKIAKQINTKLEPHYS